MFIKSKKIMFRHDFFTFIAKWQKYKAPQNA